jgi:ABC-type iron transport system FetAB permease component
MLGAILLVLFIIGFFMSSKSEKLEFLKDLFGTILFAIIGLIVLGFVVYLIFK